MGYIGHRDIGGNGVQEVWDIWPMRPTGGMGYRSMGHMGNRGTGVWATLAMGHMANGAHGQWGLWAMGPMGDLDIFVHSIIITGWILTKILLDIDIDVFYLNTGRFFYDGLN